LSAALLQLALPQVSFAAPASGANVQGLDNKADATASPSSDSEDSLTAQADSLYWQGKYQDALPLYFKLANLGSSNGGKICDSPMKLHHLSDLAVCYARLGQYDKAQRLYQRIFDERAGHYGRNSPETAVDKTYIAACYYHLEKYNKAEELCEKALGELNKANGQSSNIIAKVCLELAEVYYAEAKYDEASRAYARAVYLYDQSQGDVVEQLLLALKGEAACCYRNKQYDKATPLIERIADLECTIHGNNDVRYGWALLNLSDVYRKLGQHDKADRCYAKCVQIFRRINIERILAEQESKGKLTTDVEATVYRRMFGHVENENIQDLQTEVEQHRQSMKAKKAMLCLPSEKSLAKVGPWNFTSTDQIDPPVWMWTDPRVKRRATLVCVHGLGLNARTYEAFARAIAPRGFATLALDMRGFGTYATLKGKDRADFEGSLEDLQAVLKTMRTDKSKTPIFILGESMGGAIALQFTARNPNLVDGLICSVPAGTRYKSKKTDLKVFFGLLKGANKPFNIGKEVINQATAKEGLKEEWENDPFNRLELTPKELVSFQQFMNQNKSAASKIKDRPVIFFQGGQDKLVKAQGTLNIFKEVAAPDKDLVLLGSSEHLIFEEGQFEPSVIYGVVGWVLSHIMDQENLNMSTASK
jgi:alpha-beta hydrolase superfamily lysophospholipase